MLAINFQTQQEYDKQRNQLYQKIREEGIFTWDYYWEDQDEYALASVLKITSSFRKEIAFATEELGKIFRKSVQVIKVGANELLLEIGIPEETWEAVRLHLPYEPVTAIGRFDFANTKNGLKMLEFNSDTPTSLVEAFYLNEKVCGFYDLENPNRGEAKKITEAFQKVVQCYQQEGYSIHNSVFSALGWHREDAGTARYLLRMSGLPGKFVPLERIAIHPINDGLFYRNPETDEYEQVDFWYRLHAMEHLAMDQTNEGYPFGKRILQAIADKKLAVFNPPSAFLAQTKALQALVWALYEAGQFFEKEEQEIIRTYMLPTYLENTFLSDQRSYVKKPFFGREGGAVTIFDKNGNLIAQDQGNEYWDQQMVYQEAVELEVVTAPTLKGEFSGRLLWGSFLVDGKSSALVTRLGDRITGDDSYFLPISY